MECCILIACCVKKPPSFLMCRKRLSSISVVKLLLWVAKVKCCIRDVRSSNNRIELYTFTHIPGRYHKQGQEGVTIQIKVELGFNASTLVYFNVCNRIGNVLTELTVHKFLLINKRIPTTNCDVHSYLK